MGLSADDTRLARLLGHDDLGWLVTRVRRRLARGESLDTSVTLADATPAQRAAVQRLLGRRARPGVTLTVSLAAVDEIIRRSGACPDGLAAAVVALTGEVSDRAAVAAELDRRWEQAFAPLAAVVAERSELEDWYARIRSSGLVRRLTGSPDVAAPLLADLANVLCELPVGGEPLGRFAARVAGGAHALDDDRPLATLALGAVRALTGLADGSGAHGSGVHGSGAHESGVHGSGAHESGVHGSGVHGSGVEARRETWAAVGLLRDDVSTTVLTLGLPGDPVTPTGRALAAWRDAGQPVVLTLRQLVRDPPLLAGAYDGQVVSVCENPSVVGAAADRLGVASRPLVCTNGQPSAAVMHLLRMLVAAGADLRYHGDFDWGGIRIGNVMFARLPVRPWRFDAAAYRAVADVDPSGESAHASVHPWRALSGTPVTPTWDAELGGVMARLRASVEEEVVLDDLLGDLRDEVSLGPGAASS
ncbi:MAG: TIGR02679 family protein [Actinopolymorphaceae bacterium]